METSVLADGGERGRTEAELQEEVTRLRGEIKRKLTIWGSAFPKERTQRSRGIMRFFRRTSKAKSR